MTDDLGGQIFFSSIGRSLVDEDEIVVLSVGVDIGSSTSHLVFSRIMLERLDSRYVVTARETFYQSDILLTPYSAEGEIDADALGRFIESQYRNASVDPDEIDTGALILTGVAARRRNARRIGELFARQAGKMVAVSAGDSLESVMAAYGSGAVARSIRDRATVMNVDVGGGTTKVAVCADGRVTDLTALDVGARLVCLDPSGRIERLEEAAHRFAAEDGIDLMLGRELVPAAARALAAGMAEAVFEAMRGGSPAAGGASLLRLPPLSARAPIEQIVFSGGVAEYIYGRAATTFGDLGAVLAQEIASRVARRGRSGPCSRARGSSARTKASARPSSGPRNTPPRSAAAPSTCRRWTSLPLRNVPVIAPAFALDGEAINSAAVAASITAVLGLLDLGEAGTPVAVFVPWRGSATFQRLDAFCQGVVDGLAPILADGHPLVLAGDGDVGGLMGVHLREETRLDNAIVSVDGLNLAAFDYIDIGAMLPSSGAVPVVIKSLIFPASDAPGSEWQPSPRAAER